MMKKYWANFTSPESLLSEKELKNFLIQDHLSWSSRPWPVMNSTENNKLTLEVLWQVSAWSKEDSVWLLQTIQLSKGKSYFIQRNLLPHHCQKTFEGPRNCHGKQASMFLSCRFRRSQPSKTKRCLPCWRTFRKNLLQYGPNVIPRNPSSLFGLGKLHCRWSLCTSHGWLKHHCQK